MPGKLVRHSLQLREAVLMELSVDRHTELPDAPISPLKLDVDNWGVVLEPGLGHSFVRVSIGFEDAETTPFDVQLIFRGTVTSSDPPPTATAFETFLKEEGLYLLWPYVRQEVAHLTVQMGFPALMLPTLAHSKQIVERSEEPLDAEHKLPQN